MIWYQPSHEICGALELWSCVDVNTMISTNVCGCAAEHTGVLSFGLERCCSFQDDCECSAVLEAAADCVNVCLCCCQTAAESPVQPVVSVYYPAASTAHLGGKSALLCVASAMFPPVVRFSWKRRWENDPAETKLQAEGEQLELRESGRSAAIKLVDVDALYTYKYSCYVQHELGTVEAPTEQGDEGLVTVFSSDWASADDWRFFSTASLFQRFQLFQQPPVLQRESQQSTSVRAAPLPSASSPSAHHWGIERAQLIPITELWLDAVTLSGFSTTFWPLMVFQTLGIPASSCTRNICVFLVDLMTVREVKGVSACCQRTENRQRLCSGKSQPV